MRQWLGFALAAGVVAISPLTAQVMPGPGNGDPHIQTVRYQADQVVQLESAPGYQLTVALAADDHIESVAVGDSSAWQVSSGRAGNHLFLKPLKGGVRTNMTVVTSTRVYAFDLVSLSSASASMPYMVQFLYPAAQAKDADTDASTSLNAVVGRYKLHGDHALYPSAISDDGTHVYIRWPEKVALPATYFRDDKGAETLANGHMRDGLYVLDNVHDRLIFRINHHDAHADRFVQGEAQ